MAKKKNRQKEAPTPAQNVRSGRPLLFALGGVAALALIAAISVAAIVVSGGGDGDSVANTGDKKVIIVDQLNLTHPGPDFISDARSTLARAGYTVDYIAGDAVSVDTYRTLASHNYDLVILRVHAGITTEVDAETGEKSEEEYVSLFTNEPFDEAKYPSDIMNRLGNATYSDGSGGFFGIGPEFIKNIPGDFGGAPIILMGCDGLKSQRTADAFLDKGAGSFVSWSDQVSGSFTDTATERLLKYWLIDGMPLEDAVTTTADEVGADPTYAGELRILTG